MQETQEVQVQSLAGVQADTPEQETVTHSSILASKILWTDEAGRLHSMGLQELDMTECVNINTNTHTQYMVL